MTKQSEHQVRAVHCDYRAEDEVVYEALKRSTEPLTHVWDKLKKAKTIGIKFNQDFPPNRQVMFDGMRQALVSDKVTRAVLRLLREKTTAELFVADVSAYRRRENTDPRTYTQIAPVLDEFGVPYVNADLPPFGVYQVPGGGQMFKQYVMPECLMQADELVNVQRMKNHAFMGITLTLKNLFGLVPMREPDGRSRQYFHHLVRMPYMLPDIGRLFDPVLNIIDGLIGQTGGEWSATGEEAPRITNTLIAGDFVLRQRIPIKKLLESRSLRTESRRNTQVYDGHVHCSL